MRCLKTFVLYVVLGMMLTGLSKAQTYMSFEFDGQSVMARPVSFKDTHVQLALQAGGYTNVPWGRLSQKTLKSLTEIKNYKAFATPFLDVDPVPPPAPSKLTAKEVERMERPSGQGIMASPVMWLFFLVMYAGNIYAGYEIAVYRQRNRPLVCTVSAFLPAIGPIIYLAMPSWKAPEEVVEETVEESTETVAAEAAPAQAEEKAADAPAAPAQQAATVYERGQFTFNRRFFETKLAGFLKMVPGDAEKDMVIAIKSSRGEYVGTRLTRVSPNDITLHVVSGGASKDVMIPYSEITEIKIRHKDAH